MYGGFLDFVAASPAVARAALITYQDYTKYCVKRLVRVPGDDEPIFWGSVLRITAAYSLEECLEHCKKFLMSMMKLHRRRFYFGVSHDTLFRWRNTEFGHKWDRTRWFKEMHVLLEGHKEITREVEKQLVDQIQDGMVHDASRIPLSCLLYNAIKTPPGALVEDPAGNHYLYLLLC